MQCRKVAELQYPSSMGDRAICLALEASRNSAAQQREVRLAQKIRAHED
jgi:hypothetical protein